MMQLKMLMTQLKMLMTQYDAISVNVLSCHGSNRVRLYTHTHTQTLSCKDKYICIYFYIFRLLKRLLILLYLFRNNLDSRNKKYVLRCLDLLNRKTCIYMQVTCSQYGMNSHRHNYLGKSSIGGTDYSVKYC